MIPVSERVRTAQRSLLATLEITALASGAHVLAGGHLPAPEFLLAFSVVVFAGAQLAIGRFLHVALVVPFVFAAQVGLHATVEAAQPVHAGMAMPVSRGGVLDTSPAMFWAHLVTALVTAIVLLLQERLLGAAASWFGSPALAPLGSPTLLRSATGPADRRPRQALLAVSPRRGPPPQVLAATS